MYTNSHLFNFNLLFSTFMDHMGFLILILKCNQDIEMMKQYITDSNLEKTRNEEKKRKREKEKKEKKYLASIVD